SSPSRVLTSPDAIETAGTVWKFGKQFKKKGIFAIVGGYDTKVKALIDAGTMQRYGQIPPREVLLTQLVGLLISPIRSLAYVLDQRAKQNK
ncbi:MAG: hypothetical protein AAB601_01510, partial [Patescibacteria group bacterium]